MELCEGARGARHEGVVHEAGVCPMCETRCELTLMEKERDAALERAVEAEEALAKFETDLTHAMRMMREAKQRAEEKDDTTA